MGVRRRHAERLGERHGKRLRSSRSQLGDVLADGQLSGAELRGHIIEELTRELDCSHATIWQPQRQLGGGWEFAFHDLAGFASPVSFDRHVRKTVAKVDGRFGRYDPRRPDKRDANRVVPLPAIGAAKHDPPIPMWRALEETELRGFDQLRLLVCDGRRRLLAGITVHRDEPFRGRERRLLNRWRGALRARLEEEDQVRAKLSLPHALDVALELLGRAAVVVDRDGRVERENVLAQVVLADRAVRARLKAVVEVGESADGFVVEPLPTTGATPLYFVAFPEPRESRLSFQVALAAQRWRLTPRQRQVLDQVATGEPYKAIASELGCTDKNVEYHMSQLFDRAGATSRSELVAELWRLT